MIRKGPVDILRDRGIEPHRAEELFSGRHRRVATADFYAGIYAGIEGVSA